MAASSTATASVEPTVHQLLVHGRAVAPLEIARTRTRRAIGLIGRDRIDGALLLPCVRSVHSFGMRRPIDVARLDRAGVVLRIDRLVPRRVLPPCRGARHTLEAAEGALGRWGVHVGSVLDAGPRRPG